MALPVKQAGPFPRTSLPRCRPCANLLLLLLLPLLLLPLLLLPLLLPLPLFCSEKNDTIKTFANKW